MDGGPKETSGELDLNIDVGNMDPPGFVFLLPS